MAQPPTAQADLGERLTAIERRLSALERQANPGSPAAAPAAVPVAPPPAPPLADRSGASTAPAPSNVAPPSDVSAHSTTIERQLDALEKHADTASLVTKFHGLRKGLTEPEVIALLGPPVKVTRGVVDVFFYGPKVEPNVNLQYGRVIGWND